MPLLCLERSATTVATFPGSGICVKVAFAVRPSEDFTAPLLHPSLFKALLSSHPSVLIFFPALFHVFIFACALLCSWSVSQQKRKLHESRNLVFHYHSCMPTAAPEAHSRRSVNVNFLLIPPPAALDRLAVSKLRPGDHARIKGGRGASGQSSRGEAPAFSL